MELYYAPLACSLAVRIVAHEAGIPLVLHQVEVFSKILTATGASYLEVAPRGQVPVLRLDDGSLLAEVSAVVQYLADLRPETGLAPAWGTPARYELLDALSFVATEVHKRVLWPQFNSGVPDLVRAHAREAAPPAFDQLERHLDGRDYLVGDRFTVADAYLVWALQLAQLAGLEPAANRPGLAAFAQRQLARPSVQQLLAEEGPQARAAMARQRP